jgi:hypothetical protein
MTFTEHQLIDDWMIESNVLMTCEMQERHTGENLSNKMKHCESEFRLERKVGSSVHDNARNMQSASEKCKDWVDGLFLTYASVVRKTPHLNYTCI